MITQNEERLSIQVPILGTALQTYSSRKQVSIAVSAVCLTFPGKVVAIRGESASVDYGPDGVRDNVNVSLVHARVGNYVLVQGGFAIRVLSSREAEEALEAWKVIRELQGD